MARIVPEAEVQAVVAMYTKDQEEALLEGSPDFVIDAIDDIDTKVSGRSMSVHSTPS